MSVRFARSIIQASALVLGLGAAAEAKDWTHVTVATEGSYPPYNSTTPSGKIIGYEPDLLQVMCGRMKITCDVVAQNFDGSIPGLTAGKFDAIMSGMSITPKRQEVIAFSAPYAQSPTTFATLKTGALAALPMAGTRISLVDKEAARAQLGDLRKALQGKVIGVQVATIQLDLLNEFLKDEVTVRTYKNNDEILLDLKAGRVDAMIGSQGNINAAVEKSKGEIVYSGPLLSGGLLGLGSGMGLRKEDVDLKAMFDKAVKDAIADGTVTTLAMKWFHFDVTPR